MFEKGLNILEYSFVEGWGVALLLPLLRWELIPAINFRFNTSMEHNAASYTLHLQWDHKEQVEVTNEQTLITQRYYLYSVVDSILLHKEAIYFPRGLFRELFFNIEVCAVLFQFYEKNKKIVEAVDSSVVQLLLHVKATLHSAEEWKTTLCFHQKKCCWLVSYTRGHFLKDGTSLNHPCLWTSEWCVWGPQGKTLLLNPSLRSSIFHIANYGYWCLIFLREIQWFTSRSPRIIILYPRVTVCQVINVMW